MSTAPEPAQTETSQAHSRLSEDIQRVLSAFAHREVALGEIVGLMRQRAYSFLLLIIALPFCTPVPLPGLSTPFGLAIAFIGLRIACGMAPWLPDRLLRIKLPATWLPGMFRAAERPVRFVERFIRPSMSWLVENPLLHRLHGAVIMLSGLLLLLPLPIPGTNFFPAVAIALLACAMLESDGRFSLAGGVFFLLALGFFSFLSLGGGAAILHFGNSLTSPEG